MRLTDSQRKQIDDFLKRLDRLIEIANRNGGKLRHPSYYKAYKARKKQELLDSETNNKN